MDFDIMMNPGKYGYKACDHCNGYGSSLKEDSDRCTKCGGDGLVKGTNDEQGQKEKGANQGS